MKVKLQHVLPQDIEKRSFEIIGQELGNLKLDPMEEPVIKRVIHTTADFDYVTNLKFSRDAVVKGITALQKGATIVSDTQMVHAGINKAVLEALGGEALCFMADADIAGLAKANGTTRAVASMNKAAGLDRPTIFAIGNAPTALVRLYELIQEGRLQPELIIGVPVGFVNVEESKELIMTLNVPYIVAKGRKGGSNVAAAICNALLYQCKPRITNC
ncbi:MAG: precorrin-8X methylmutase [Syntrophomonadaceae bacterium]|jgi:precorrin-8X/cobalt-precorrin-8 methylmutase